MSLISFNKHRADGCPANGRSGTYARCTSRTEHRGGGFDAALASVLETAGAQKTPTDAKRPAGVISLIGGYGGTPSQKWLSL
jgi:hypothetical protein